MKKYILSVVVLVLVVTSTTAQTAVEVLKQAREKCYKIQNGYIKANWKFKYMSRTDTGVYKGDIYFIKVPADSIAKRHYLLKTEKYTYHYDGKQAKFVNYEKKETGIDTVYKSYTKGNVIDGIFNFSTLNINALGIANDEDAIIDFAPGYTAASDTIVVQYSHPEGLEDNSYGKYCILKQTMLPVWFERVFTHDIGVQYERFDVEFADYNQKYVEDSIYNFKLPADMPVKYRQKYVPQKPLDTGAMVPMFSGRYYSGDTMDLANLNGKLYLIDFWYRSCAPCLQAMPFIQHMHDKYKSNGLRVLGVNSNDRNDSIFKKFVTFKEFSYPIVFVNKAVDKSYKVSGYPTMYLVDKNYKIVHVQVGYGDGVDEKLETVIKEYLEKN
jgi:thiol-disulfide isomerase/thioredoxin